MMVEPQDLSHEDTIGQLREAIQEVRDKPLGMVAPSNEIVVDQAEGSTGADHPPF